MHVFSNRTMKYSIGIHEIILIILFHNGPFEIDDITHCDCTTALIRRLTIKSFIRRNLDTITTGRKEKKQCCTKQFTFFHDPSLLSFP